MKNYITIDIGGTAIKYGIINAEGCLLLRETVGTNAQKGGNAILEAVFGIVEKLRNSGYEISGVCVSTAGIVDPEKGKIIHASPLIPDYTGTEIKKRIEAGFSLPCEVENDVYCAGLAEAVSGAAKDCGTAFVMTVGTGIGGCFLQNGEVLRGAYNCAGEVGYLHMGNGSFESLGAASVMTKKVAARKGEREADWNGYRIFQMAEAGDEVCIQAIDEMADVLGRGIANICYVLNPEVIVLGGGIMEQEKYLKDRIRGAMDRYLIPVIAEQVQLKFAAHHNNGGMVGAFYHFCRRQSIELPCRQR